jgi:hypothetical protein
LEAKFRGYFEKYGLMNDSKSIDFDHHRLLMGAGSKQEERGE